MHRKAHGLVSRARLRPKQDKLEFKTEIPRTTRQFRHTLTDTEQTSYYDGGLKPSVRDEILEELQLMAHNISFILIEIMLIAAAKKRFHRALMEHAHSQQTIYIKASKKGLTTIMLGDTLDDHLLHPILLKTNV